MIVTWHGKEVGEFDSADLEPNEFDELVETIAENILEADWNQAVSDLADWYDDGDARWFFEEFFNGNFKECTTKGFLVDAVASALGAMLEFSYDTTEFNLEVSE